MTYSSPAGTAELETGVRGPEVLDDVRREEDWRDRVELKPTDVRRERDGAARLLLRTILLSALRLFSLLAADAAVLVAASVLVAWVSHGFGLSAFEAWMPPVAIVFGYSALLTLGATGTYGAGDARREPVRVGRAIVLAGAGTVALTQLVPQIGAWEHAALLTMTATVMVIASRLVVDRLARSIHLGGYLRRRVLLVGDEDSSTAVLSHFKGPLAARLHVVGRLAVNRRKDPDARGDIDDIDAFLDHNRVDAVVISRTMARSLLGTLVGACFTRGIPVEFVPAVVRDRNWDVRPRVLFGCPLLEIRPARLGLPQTTIKRAVDIVIGAATLLVLSPVLLIVSAAIKLDSRGPVFFRQTRAGLGGRAFQMWKFRTMKVDADHEKESLQHLNASGDPRLFKIASDPRITRVGKVLRRLSLDELPQLINVLRGEMSLVGPRPFFPEDLEHYETHHFDRLSVLPGITGLWQVRGRSDITDFESVVELDREYIRRWSLGLDFEILLKTLPAVLRRDGAY